jgi:hypothetical protein
MNCFIDEGCETFPIMKQKFFLLGKERLWIGVRLGSEWNGLDQAVMPFSD